MSEQSSFLGENTNNRLESINQKIKSVVSTHSNMGSFFDQQLSFLSTIRNERDHTALMAIAKRRVVTKSPVEKGYAQHLTPFEFDRVVQQLREYKKVHRQMRYFSSRLSTSFPIKRAASGSIFVWRMFL